MRCPSLISRNESGTVAYQFTVGNRSSPVSLHRRSPETETIRRAVPGLVRSRLIAMITTIDASVKMT